MPSMGNSFLGLELFHHLQGKVSPCFFNNFHASFARSTIHAADLGAGFELIGFGAGDQAEQDGHHRSAARKSAFGSAVAGSRDTHDDALGGFRSYAGNFDSRNVLAQGGMCYSRMLGRSHIQILSPSKTP